MQFTLDVFVIEYECVCHFLMLVSHQDAQNFYNLSVISTIRLFFSMHKSLW